MSEQNNEDSVGRWFDCFKFTPQTLNEWRIVPRVIVVLYGYVFWMVVTWFMDLPDPNSQQAAFVSTIVGAAAAFFGIYTNTGKK